MPGRTDDKIRCSFCGKTQDQVRKLIAGTEMYISAMTVSNSARRFWKRNLPMQEKGPDFSGYQPAEAEGDQRIPR